ncbi:transmembrane protein 272-like isoform X2 [Takifugu flavidus]|uniref:transmembrane protein 272-like isoform X2 n=1 Tax=Takifugu flavidus TaxID=433684 RepID=UPI002544AE45|nr:transmembrane protein 272-like isoform X2 [Takifugu flavidus]
MLRNAHRKFMEVSEPTGMEVNSHLEMEDNPHRVIVISIVGAKHLDQCPIQPNIPMYLIVMGVIILLALLLTYTRTMFENPLVFAVATGCMVFLHFHNFCWLIAGSVWIYSLYPPNYNPENLYCHKTTYQFAFGMTTAVWATMGFMIIIGYCFESLHGCRSDDNIISDQIPYGATVSESAAGDV